MMKRLIVLTGAALIFFSSHAQESSILRQTTITGGILEVKESSNFGLVFKGPEFTYGMNWTFQKNNNIIIYEYDLGLSILFTKEIPGLGFYLKPADFSYLFKLPVGENSLFSGPSAKIEYFYNLYPDLQAGFDYWFTNISFGINTIYNFDFRKSSFDVKMNTSLFGFTSRQPEYRDPYFYDIGLNHALEHLNQDLTFSSFGKYNATDFEILWRPENDSRIALGYVLRYRGYYDSPEYTTVGHSIKLLIRKKQR